MERIYFLAKVERGLDDAKEGRTVTQKDIERLFLE